MKKRLLSALLAVTVVSAVLAGCGSKEEPKAESKTETKAETETQGETETKAESEDVTETTASNGDGQVIKVGATPSPHAEILEQAQPLMAARGYELEIVDFTDYVLPNLALDTDDLDANYFQHIAYLDSFNEERSTNLVSVQPIHYEPFGIYAGKTASLEDLADGAQIAVPNDTTNEARALLLLEAQGFITLKEDAGITATVRDIVDNPKNLKIVELEAAQVPLSLQDVDLAVINGNYAMQAGLNVNVDALAVEKADSLAATTYANVLVVNSGNEDNEAIKALVDVLLSEEIKTFIEEKYEGAVVPLS